MRQLKNTFGFQLQEKTKLGITNQIVVVECQYATKDEREASLGAKRISVEIKNIFDLKNIQSGKTYNVICSKDSNSAAKCFIYQKSKIEYVVFDFRDTIIV